MTTPKFKHRDFLSIATPATGKDYELFKSIVNQGIDSYLEAFCKSQFFFDCGKFHFHFHRSEKRLLLRRLNETLDKWHGKSDSEDIEYLERWIEDITNYDQLVKE